MKNILLLIIPFFILGCSKKEINIPTIAASGIQEIQNHSQVWLFFEVKNSDTIAEVNRKNTISTTHWIFNIDKKLPLKAIVPSLIDLRYKHANSFHSKEGMHNYFSYSDTSSKKLSFIEFDDVIYKPDSILSKYYIKKHSSNYIKYNNINITINPKNAWINDAKIEPSSFKETLIEFIEFSSEGMQTMLHLNFNQNLTYQEYLYYKTMFLKLESENIIANKIEFIFDLNKVPDCGCD